MPLIFWKDFEPRSEILDSLVTNNTLINFDKYLFKKNPSGDYKTLTTYQPAHT